MSRNAQSPRLWIAMAASALALGACGGGGSGGTNTSTGVIDKLPASGPTTATQVMADLKAGTAVDPQIVAADNSFGLAVLDQLLPTATANLAISPTSVALALQMTYNGAAGSTSVAMAQALQLGTLDVATMNADNAALQAALVNPDPMVQLTIADSLWMHLSDNPVLPSFIDENQTYYGAAVGDLAGAPANINDWVSTQTNGLITNILPADFNPALTTVEIVNAIYFKAPWSSPFDATQTAAASFTLANGTQADCQMMHQTGPFPYWQGPNFQLVSLPYGNSGRMSMLILLPASGVDLGSLVAGITDADLTTWISQMQTLPGAVAMPRFTSNFSASLVPALSAMGMSVAFGLGADFSNLAMTSGIHITSVQHATVVDVDESGTVAAGATSVGVGITAVLQPQFAITLDHPFLYAIRDNTTGALLFIGAVINPS